MATSSSTSINTPASAMPKGRDIDALGPSDTSDSGSDVQGERPMATAPDNAAELGGLPVESGSNTDSTGTGERGSATGDEPEPAADLQTDRIIERSDSAVPDLPPDA